MNISTQAYQKNVKPEAVLELLKEGNKRFVNHEQVVRNLLDQVDIVD